MNRHAIPACLLSALLGGAIVAPAQAGGAINRCVDGAGRVTLTDQPCDAHTVSSTVAVPGTPDADTAPHTPLYGNAVLPSRTAPAPRPARWLPPAAPHVVPYVAPYSSPYAALSGDMATLKQARLRMLQEDAPRTRLASLDR